MNTNFLAHYLDIHATVDNFFLRNSLDYTFVIFLNKNITMLNIDLVFSIYKKWFGKWHFHSYQEVWLKSKEWNCLLLSKFIPLTYSSLFFFLLNFYLPWLCNSLGKNALVGIHILPIKLAACIQLKGIKTENQIKAELVFW